MTSAVAAALTLSLAAFADCPPDDAACRCEAGSAEACDQAAKRESSRARARAWEMKAHRLRHPVAEPPRPTPEPEPAATDYSTAQRRAAQGLGGSVLSIGLAAGLGLGLQALEWRIQGGDVEPFIGLFLGITGGSVLGAFAGVELAGMPFGPGSGMGATLAGSALGMLAGLFCVALGMVTGIAPLALFAIAGPTLGAIIGYEWNSAPTGAGVAPALQR